MKASHRCSLGVLGWGLLGSALLFFSPICRAAAPIVLTTTATSPTLNSITLNGTVYPNGADATGWFQYGLTTAYGSTTAVFTVSAANLTAVPVSNVLAGLPPTTTYHYRLVATNSSGTSSGADFTFSTTTFSNLNLTLPGVENAMGAWGDYDNDGLLDFLLTGIGTNGTAISQVWHNQGNGVFTNLNAGLPGILAGSIAWGDYDNDGRLDILLAGNGLCQVWHNQANGTFTNLNAGLPALFTCSAAWGDFDNDGRPDIILSGTTNNAPAGIITQIWRNQGNGTFSNLNLALPALLSGVVAPADFDNDGNLDFLLSGTPNNGNFTNSVSQLWRNLGNGSFTNIGAVLPGFTTAIAAWADYDNDGKLDFALSGAASNATSFTQIWHNQGNGIFTNLPPNLFGFTLNGVAWADYDNDGRPDLLVSSLGSLPSQLYHNAGNGSFTNISPGLPALYYGRAAWGDFDNDGRLDILAMGTTNASPNGSLSQLYRSGSPVANTAPAAPSGLAASVNSPGGVLLTWTAGSDAETPAAGLSYNLRIGSTPGGSDILSPAANTATGFRRIPQLGNVGQRLFANLTNLPAATTYYWSVQTVDSAYAGSTFAAEKSFSFPTTAPVIANAQVLNLASTSATLSAQVNPGGPATTVYILFGATTAYGATNILNIGNGNAFVSASQNLIGLTASQGYHFQILATNSLGGVTSGDIAFSTPAQTAPSATTLPATGAGLTSVTLNGSANPNGVSTTVYFLYGPTTAYGLTNLFGNIGGANTLVPVSKLISSLAPGQIYHFQVMASNSLGIAYGADLTFTNTVSAPSVSIFGATSPSLTTITLNGSVNPNGLDATAWFQYGLTTAYGGLSPTFAISATNLTFAPVSSPLTGLTQTTTYHCRLVATNSLGTTFGGDVTFSTATFSNLNAILPGVTAAVVAWGDYDNDGQLDFLLTGTATNNQPISQIWHNQGNGTFTNLNAGLTGVTTGSAAWGDYDNDGRLDVLLAGNGLCQVWHNQANGTFTNLNAGLPALYAGTATWGDFNNDGRLDIILTGSTNNGSSGVITQIWRNQGNGTFLNLNLGLPGLYLSYVATADYDNDGNLDFLLTGSTNTATFLNAVSQLWHNQGDGTFAIVNVIGLSGYNEGTVSWGDYDNDGFLDFALSGIGTNSFQTAQIWHNQGNGAFTNLNLGLPGTRQGSVPWGDYDNDGRADLLLAGSGGPGQLFHNVGGGSFTNISPGLPSVSYGRAAWGDFDNDGRLDILAVGSTNGISTGAIAQLFRNSSPAANTAPASPANLTSATNSAGGVLLSWTAGSDAETPAAGLSYNLRIGSTPGGSDILSPAANTTTGYRRVPQLGNAGPRLFASLTNLPVATTYYWSVQTVDGAYAGSAFAAEKSFSFPVATPLIANAQMLNLASTTATLSAQVNPQGAATTVRFLFGTTTGYGSTNVFSLGSSNAFASVVQNVTGLIANQGYHFQVVASNSSGTVSSGDIAFSTLPVTAPSATTLPATFVGVNTATLNGSANPNGGATTVYFLYGPTTAYGITNLFGTLGNSNSFASVSRSIGGLAPGQVYHFQVMASNSLGIAYGADLTFTNTVSAPSVSIFSATSPSLTTITLNGSVNPNGLDATAWFQYGLTTAYGGLSPTFAISATNLTFAPVSSPLTGLTQTTTYHCRLVATNSLGTTFGGDVTFSTATFAKQGPVLPGVSSASVVWGDYDNDGLLDFLIAGISTNGSPIAQVWHNQGAGNFTNLNVALPGVGPGSVAWGDYDNDGKLDILIAGSGVCQVWHNSGNGTFTNLNAGLPALYLCYAAWGDFDNDGKSDIILTGTTNGGPSGVVTQIWRNNGNGTFSNLNVSLPGLYYSSVALGDFDNDGNLDLVLSGTQSAGTPNSVSQIWRNTGNFTFTNINAGLPGLASTAVSWADYDNDGFLDLAISGVTTNLIPISQLWHNQGNGTFTNLNLALAGQNLGAVPWGDYDNDGRPDLLAAAGGSTPSPLYHNLGNGGFTNISPGLPAVFSGRAAWGDFDNDGRLDILTVGTTNNINSGGISQLFKNYSPVANTPPSAPSSLVASTNSPGSFLLSWSAGSDAETPVSGLNYNVRVGTTPGGSDVLSPQADPVTGFRRVPQLGNAQEGLSLTLTNLPVGTNYWSVQTIDGAYAGSPFAAEGTFSVSSALAVVTTLPASGITATNAVLNATVQPNGSGAAFFEYGLDTSYGAVVTATNLPATTNLVSISYLVGLVPASTYHYRAVATNSLGTTFGNDQSFDTLPAAPTIGTPAPGGITQNGATLNASINPEGLDTAVYFQYGLTTAYGTYTDPTFIGIGNTNMFVTLNRTLTGLNPNTTYHYQLVASNSLGLVFGPDQTFVTLPNAAPTISGFANLATPLNTPLGPIPFTVSDAETPAASLIVAASSGNLILVPQSNLALGGFGTNRSLFIAPVVGQRGSTIITVSVSDGLAVTSKSFVLNVGAVSGDLNGDGIVDQNEFNGILTNYLQTSPLYMTRVVKGNSGNFQFSLTNANAWSFSVLASTNLVNWDPLSAPAIPVFQFFDPQAATNAPYRFYRLRYP